MGSCRHGNDRDDCLDEVCWLSARRHATALDQLHAEIVATLGVSDEQAAWTIERVRAHYLGRVPAATPTTMNDHAGDNPKGDLPGPRARRPWWRLW